MTGGRNIKTIKIFANVAAAFAGMKRNLMIEMGDTHILKIHNYERKE